MEPVLIVAGAFYFITKGIEFEKQKESGHNSVIQELKIRLMRIDPSFSQLRIYENRDTYTYNKKEIYICLKDENGRYYDINTLTYVMLHEVAHMITNGEKEDHDEKFRKNFDGLLYRAEKVGVWDKRKKLPIMYCGVHN